MPKRPALAALGALLVVLAAAPALAGTPIKLPTEISGPKAAVPTGWVREIVTRGDLNGDGREDLAVLLRDNDPALIDADKVNSNPRILAVYFGQAGGGYRLVAENRQLIPVGGPAASDPIEGIAYGGVTIAHGHLRVRLGVFGSEVGSLRFTFGWRDKRLVLTGYDADTISRTDNSETIDSYNYLTARWSHSVQGVSDDKPTITWHDLSRHRLEALGEIGNGYLFDPSAPPPIPKADWNWADADLQGLPDDPGLKATQKICAGLRDLEPPMADRPGGGGPAQPGPCDAEALYYGIGEKADPAKARACAFYEIGRADLGDDPFAGIGILMTIYANGRGAARNLDLATALACRIYGAPAELEGRIAHLQAMKDDPAKAGVFDYCDDITSGFAGAQCAAHQAAIADAKREDLVAAMMAGWSTADRTAFAPLRQAAKAYAEASADNEVDMSGTARGMFAIARRQAVLDAFAATLAKLEKGDFPPATAADTQTADSTLNGVYRKIMAIRLSADQVSGYQSADSLPSTTVTHKGIRTAERAWLAYRDAWLAFAARHAPSIGRARLAAYLTAERTADLKPFTETE